jgi:hypothetical protein
VNDCVILACKCPKYTTANEWQAQSPVESWRHKRHVTPPSVQLLAASQHDTALTDDQAAGETALLNILHGTSTALSACIHRFANHLDMR